MDAANNERILGYFIEEAKEHLETLEKGILELSSVIDDAEMVNEMFRAAHSIKGGAAMLGYTSIQKTAHRLEDSFKVLRDQKVNVDEKLESLFLQGYDFLQDLIESLESPTGFSNADAEKVVAKAEPNFVELQEYLTKLVAGGTSSTEETTPTKTTAEDGPTEIRKILKQMLAIFKQEATLESRQKLQQFCQKLSKIAPHEEGWIALVETAQKAVSNPKYSYRLLAPVIIKELKQGSDYLELGKANLIVASDGLDKLATAKSPQILITLEPTAAAKTLMKVFNKQQLAQLVKLIQTNV
ncbi:MAG: Hpt domain-containing protein [Gomphosphaeria aponina SAG 52.96 = DSM 107014]|uniref:Hpt domain-containing protein n=1 Tax=Gomphosphaeria aponina SAG 52.96 = DSM 107014 TaxID=1521640 RepID=A0A941GN86_9CHRO|nr:Hpt domain-containing protein [Gomphosphaeria aponina SAG 52.96 = DSM 107014]